jgi:HEAT repeat protein
MNECVAGLNESRRNAMTDHAREITQLLLRLRSDDPPVDPEVEAAVASELHTKDAARVVAALAQGLNDQELDYRCTIASLFLRYDFVAAIPHVRLLLQDPDDDLRGFLCQELGAYGRPEAVPLLVDTLQNDPDATNRTWAAWGLGNIGDPAAVPALGLAMRSDLGEDYEGRPVKEIAAEAIRRITHEKAASVA